jgi:hypothetical protein
LRETFIKRFQQTLKKCFSNVSLLSGIPHPHTLNTLPHPETLSLPQSHPQWFATLTYSQTHSFVTVYSSLWHTQYLTRTYLTMNKKTFVCDVCVCVCVCVCDVVCSMCVCACVCVCDVVCVCVWWVGAWLGGWVGWGCYTMGCVYCDRNISFIYNNYFNSVIGVDQNPNVKLAYFFAHVNV